MSTSAIMTSKPSIPKKHFLAAILDFEVAANLDRYILQTKYPMHSLAYSNSTPSKAAIIRISPYESNSESSPNV
jgi:hypothetical protein